jgi:predicted dehydrogenase
MVRALICGIGSIGQRHYKNLKALGHEVAIYRTRKEVTLHIAEFLRGEERAGRPVAVFYDLDTALGTFGPEAVFVTNPNSAHMPVALAAVRAKRHVFLEKPVSHNLQGVDELLLLAEVNDLRVMVGYNLRFHPLLVKMKALVAEGLIGKPISANVEMAENIADWHPWEDYRDAYACWKSGGGGATLCFSHDLDYLYWFFGMPSRIEAVGGKLTPLGGDAEDMVKSVLVFPSGIVAAVHLDYWQRPPKRTFELVGTGGRLTWDYYRGTLVFAPRDWKSDQIWKLPEGFERNDMFVAEVKNFVWAIENGVDSLVTLEEGIDVLKIALEIKRKIGF